MLSPDFWWALYSFLRTGYYLSACTKRRGTICPHVQIDGVLFVRLCKSTGYYLSACAKMTGYYLSGVLFVRDSVRIGAISVLSSLSNRGEISSGPCALLYLLWSHSTAVWESVHGKNLWMNTFFFLLHN